MTNQDRLPVTIDYRVRGIDFSGELRKAVERIVVFALDRYAAQMDKIVVYMADRNGPKGGVDKLCQITAKLGRGDRVLILEQGSEILTTVNRAAHRLGQHIGRAVQRRNRPDSRRFRQSIRTT